ncbi:bifunctional hydroxymethylpyrimidine kinase/phosphomethylpyrimidine kinase [Patescibacteria group bacterium]|nr:bifunctional hydroxymethylpyrimidine kinase/phosphomethylpyrimidine kinase [Patescibacteria group bacterium]
MADLSSRDLRRFLLDARQARVAVVGDTMLDIFTYGTSRRHSPEAPVPVVAPYKREAHLGGAANVAHNIQSMGAAVELYTVVGTDSAGKECVRMLRSSGLTTRSVQKSIRPTTTKERVVVNGAHLMRIDRETTAPIRREIERALIDDLSARISRFDVLVISDYAKGVITKTLVRALCRSAMVEDIPVIVDTKPEHAAFFDKQRIRLFTPNAKEAREISGEEDLERAAQTLSRRYASPVLITRGEHGMSLYEEGDLSHAPAIAVTVQDVSGCGDTVVATTALALATKRSLDEAMHWATHAAGIVVQKSGTATVTPKEFISAYDRR